jgi:hypothetical protein
VLSGYLASWSCCVVGTGLRFLLCNVGSSVLAGGGVPNMRVKILFAYVACKTLHGMSA